MNDFHIWINREINKYKNKKNLTQNETEYLKSLKRICLEHKNSRYFCDHLTYKIINETKKIECGYDVFTRILECIHCGKRQIDIAIGDKSRFKFNNTVYSDKHLNIKAV